MTPKVVYSNRRTLAITVNEYGEVVVRAPKGTCLANIDKYLVLNHAWITKRQQKAIQLNSKLYTVDFDSKKIKEYKKSAKEIFTEIADRYKKETKSEFKKLRLSSAKKRWGSCNNEKTVSINWKLYFAPKNLQEYVVLHEIAHLKNMNHGESFWKSIESIMPDYKQRRKELKEYEHLLLLEA